MQIGVIGGNGNIKAKDLLKYLKENPHEAERFNQCFNCLKLKDCKNDCKEDENGMCKECVPIRS